MTETLAKPSEKESFAEDVAANLVPIIAREIRRVTKPAGQLLASAAAARYLGYGVTQFYELSKQPGFPKRVSVPGCKPAYRRSDLDRWVESRPAARGKKLKETEA